MLANQSVTIDEKKLVQKQTNEIEQLIVEESQGKVDLETAKTISEQIGSNLKEQGPIYHKDIRALVRFDILPKIQNK